MADQDKDATQQGASEGGTEQQNIGGALTPRHTERENEIELIAARRRKQFEEENGVNLGDGAAAPEKTTEPEQKTVEAEQGGADASSSALALAEQIAKQLEAGTFVLTDDILSKAVVNTKVDGREETVPASKALGQYQKGAAADMRLAEATRASKEASDLLRQAQERASAATTDAANTAAEAKKVATSEQFAQLTKDHSVAVFSGDDEKAAQLLDQILDLKLQSTGRADGATPTPAPTIDEVVQKAVPAIQQRLDVESALARLKTDYPEIWADPDYATIADMKRDSYEAQGKTRAEAIALAGEDVGRKFGIGKHRKTDVSTSTGPTTRDQKLAAKEGLDEPNSAATRATTATKLPPSPSQIIAEMAASRGQAVVT